MQSLKELYKIGRGPSSSHTIGPERICEYIKSISDKTSEYKVVLYGSLAYTGKGHGTDRVIREVLGESTQILFDTKTKKLNHPNTMDVIVKTHEKEKTYRAESVGGGDFKLDGVSFSKHKDVYSLNTFDEIKEYVLKKGIRLSDYVYETEPYIKEYLKSVWQVMKECIESGLREDGILQGGLKVERKAKILYNEQDGEDLENRLISSYALAVAEQNADNKLVVTSPTCGASGVLPSVLYYHYKDKGYGEDKIIDGLATAGLIGNIVKTNASISGAECGCQAEIGTACAMASVAICEMHGLKVNEIECAGEVALEHNLGLTCDPVGGLVQVPCIERNVMASLRAMGAYTIAKHLADMRKISFDTIVKTMYETGKDIKSKYRETANGGIAKYFVGE